MMSGQSPQCSLYHLCHSQVRYSGQSGPECAGTEFLGPVAMLSLKASRKEQFLGTTNCLGLFCSYSITSSCHSAVLLSYANEIKSQLVIFVDDNGGGHGCCHGSSCSGGRQLVIVILLVVMMMLLADGSTSYSDHGVHGDCGGSSSVGGVVHGVDGGGGGCSGSSSVGG